MKQHILLTTLLLTPIYGMNYNPCDSNSWDCDYTDYNLVPNIFSIIPSQSDSSIQMPTQINVRLTSLFQINSDTALTVVGLHQQRLLGSKKGFFNMTNSIPNPSTKASSDDELLYEYNPFHNKKQAYFPLTQKVIYPILEIVEPIIINGVYRTYRYTNDPSCNPALFSFENQKAIDEVINDLTFCYQKALSLGLSQLKNYYIKDIAFPTLSVNESFTQKHAIIVAIQSVLSFLKENPNQYSNIIFFTENMTTFELYKNTLIQYCATK